MQSKLSVAAMIAILAAIATAAPTTPGMAKDPIREGCSN